MHTAAIGLALVVSMSGVAPAPTSSFTGTEPIRPTLSLREAAARTSIANSTPPVSQRRGHARRSRWTTADRVIAVAAGASLGWVAGGAIGWVATADRNDDVSGLRGVVIGAPVGAVAGALVGYRLTK
jgi:hypothetical protein